jgi:biopolymer transport protein TolR
MAMTLAVAAAWPQAPAGRGARRWRRSTSRRLVDVMLVLLIIFMVTAPLLTAGVPVDLPDSNAKPLNQNPSEISLSITNDGVIYLGETALAPGESGAGVG